MDTIKAIWVKYKWRIIGSAAGLVLAVLLFSIGFWKTLLVVLLALIGFLLGYFKDSSAGFKSFVDDIVDKLKK